MPAALRLSAHDARRFHRRAVLLDAPASGIDAALTHHGYIQIDPINVCGRMHDLILRNRVAGYREGDLIRHLHGAATIPRPAAERTAFEHHLPRSDVLAAMPIDAWPYLLSAMRRRSRVNSSWSGTLDARQRPLAKSILAEIASRGPVCSDDIDDDQRDHQGWGAHASLAKTTLHKLFFHGRVLIARRVGHRRFYDLPERVLPPGALASPEPTIADTHRWITLLKLRQRRLVTLSRAESRHVADFVQPIAVEGCPPLYCLRADLPVLDNAVGPRAVPGSKQPRGGGVAQSDSALHPLSNVLQAGDGSRSAVRAPSFAVAIGSESASSAPMLLAPLDPLIYDRRLTRQLWGYDYTWEVYTPPAKRVRGYYALPLLAGIELVGHIDPKADRANRKLMVVNRSLRRGHRAASAVRGLAGFLGLK